MDSFEGTDQYNRLFQVVLTEGFAVWRHYIATSTEGCNVACLIIHKLYFKGDTSTDLW